MRGMTSLAVLVGLVGGVPLALSAMAGWPLPRAWPRWEAIPHVLSQSQIPDSLLVKAAACVCWVTWAVLVTCVAVEVAAWLGGYAARRLPVVGPFQVWAARLVASALLVFSSFGALVRPAAAVPLRRIPPVVSVVGAVQAPALGSSESVSATRGDAYRAPLRAATADMPAPVAVESPIPDGAKRYTVAPPEGRHRDTLWGIAERHLGNPERWPEIFDLNKGRCSAGHRVANPHWIHPGEVLIMPADAVEVDGPATAPPLVPAPATLVPAALSAKDALTLPTLSNPPTPFDSERPPRSARRPAAHDPDPIRLRAGNLLRDGLLAAGVVLLLDRLRRARQRRRLPGERLRMPDPELAGRELALRAGADVDEVAFLAAGLSMLSRRLREEILKAPEVACVRLTAHGIEFLLSRPAPVAPGGFDVEASGDRWVLPRSACLEPARRESAPDPLPALVSVGNEGAGDQVLINLEQAGLVSLGGESRLAHQMLLAMATELASRPSAHKAIVLVGFGDHLASFDGVQIVESLAEVIDDLERQAEEVDALVRGAGHSSIYDARVCAPRYDSWAPILVLCWKAPAGELADRLVALSTNSARAGVAGVVAGELAGAPWCFEMAAGEALISPLGLVVRPQRLTGAESAAIGRLVEVALDSDLPSVGVEFDSADDADHADLVEPRDKRLVEEEHVAADPAAAPESAVEVRILGPVEIVGGAEPLSRGKSVELVVHLALHRRSVIDADRLVEALWPGRPSSGRTLNTTTSVARRALGLAPDGSPNLPPVKPGGYGEYRIGSCVRLDYDRFCELVAEARRQEPAQARSTLRVALDLVRGRPFETVGRGYEWAHVEGLVTNIEAEVADAAHALAQLCLQDADAKGARWAAQRGLRASQGNEQLYRDQMFAADLAGNLAGVEKIMDELKRMAEDDDPYGSLHPETVAVYKQLTHAAT